MQCMKHGLFALALGILLCSNASAAESGNGTKSDDTADIRCLIVIGQMSEQNKEFENFAIISAMYYIGRLDGRSSKIDMEEAVVEQASLMKPADFVAEAKRCGDELTVKGKEFDVLGGNLVKRGENMQNATPSADEKK